MAPGAGMQGTWRRLISAATAVAFAAGLALLGGPAVHAADGAAGEDAVTLTIWSQASAPAVKKALADLVADYEKATPGVTVDVVDVPGDELAQKVEDAVTAGQGPDIVRATSLWVSDWASRGYLRSLDRSLDQKAVSGIDPVYRNQVTLGDNLFALPQLVDMPMLLFNRVAFAKAGLDPGKPPTTFAEFAATCSRLGAGHGSALSLGPAGFRGYYVLPWVYGAGGTLYQPAARQITVAQSATVAGVEALHSAWDAPCNVRPTSFDDDYNTALAALADGTVGMTIAGSAAIPTVIGGAGIPSESDLGVAAVPRGEKGGGAPFATRGYVLTRDTEHPDEATALVEYLTSLPAQVELAVRSGAAPTRSDAYDDPVLRDDAVAQQVHAALSAAVAEEVNPRTRHEMDAFTPAVEAVLDGTSSAPTAMGRLAQQWQQKLFPRYGIAGVDAPDDEKTLVVATKVLEPFVFEAGKNPEGFSIDLWRAVAEYAGLTYEMRVEKSTADVLEAVTAGEADVGIAGITITPEREATHEFSQGYFDSGLQIMTVPGGDTAGVWATLKEMFAGSAVQWLLIVLVVIVIAANVLWLARRREPDMPKGYLRGVGETAWESGVALASGGYGSREPSRPLTRVIALLWMFLSIVLFSVFTGVLAANLTAAKVTPGISGPQDLAGNRIATVAGSTSASYLHDQRLPFTAYQNVDLAIDDLLAGNVDAIVYDSPVLLYKESKVGADRVQVVGTVFQPERYGIALPLESPLRKQINETLLELYDDGTWEQIYQRWFPER